VRWILIQRNNQKQKETTKTMALNVKTPRRPKSCGAGGRKRSQEGGIIIPDTAKEKPMESLVVALGTGKTDDNGKKVPFEVKKGDRVLVSKYGAPKSSSMARNTRSSARTTSWPCRVILNSQQSIKNEI